MLAYDPQPLARLQARYPEALVPLFVAEDAASGGPRPGNQRPHVFDCEDGMRLIISRELIPDGRIILHLSGSFRIGSPMAEKIGTGIGDAFELFALIGHRYQEISGRMGQPVLLQFVGLSPMGIPHFAETMAEATPAPVIPRGSGRGVTH